jgi:hypothetical protein
MPEIRTVDYTIDIRFTLFEANNIEEVDSFVVVAETKLPISNEIRSQEQLNELLFGDTEVESAGSEQEISDNPTTESIIDIALDTVSSIIDTDIRLNGYNDPGAGRSQDILDHIYSDYENKTIYLTMNLFKYPNFNHTNNNNNNTNNNNNNNNNSLNNLLLKKSNNNNNNNETKKITNTIMGNIIENGNILGNFHAESDAKRYYKRKTVKRLLDARYPTNPYTRVPLKRENVTYYKARLPNHNGGRRRRNTHRRSHRNTRRASNKKMRTARKHRK